MATCQICHLYYDAEPGDEPDCPRCGGNPEDWPPKDEEERCPECGYTEQDARTLMDHRYCRKYGKAPWSETRGERIDMSFGEDEEDSDGNCP